MPYEVKHDWICPHTEAVYCNPNERCCEKCGWNPVVVIERFNKYCYEHNIPFNVGLLSMNEEG